MLNEKRLSDLHRLGSLFVCEWLAGESAGGEQAGSEIARQGMEQAGNEQAGTPAHPNIAPPPIPLPASGAGEFACAPGQLAGEFAFAPGLGVLGEGVGLKVYNYAIFGNELFGGIGKMLYLCGRKGEG